jgi:hypothetical protein
MGKSSTPSAPTLGQDINDVVRALPALYGGSAAYDPAFQSLNLQQLNDAIFGSAASEVATNSTASQSGWYDANGNLVDTNRRAFGAQPGRHTTEPVPVPDGYRYVKKGGTISSGTRTVAAQPGLLAMYQQAMPQLQGMQNQANTDARTANVADVNALAPGLRTAWQGANQQQSALLDALNQQANQQMQLGSRLDPDSLAQIRSNVMGQASDRGWGYSPGDMGQVAMTTGQAGEALRAQRQGFAGNVAQYNQAASIDPFAALLNTQSNAQGNAMQLFGTTGAGMNQSPISGLLGYAHDNSMTAYNGAVSTANANANSQASIGGAVVGGGAMIGAAAIM